MKNVIEKNTKILMPGIMKQARQSFPKFDEPTQLKEYKKVLVLVFKYATDAERQAEAYYELQALDLLLDAFEPTYTDEFLIINN